MCTNTTQKRENVSRRDDKIRWVDEHYSLLAAVAGADVDADALEVKKVFCSKTSSTSSSSGWAAGGFCGVMIA